MQARHLFLYRLWHDCMQTRMRKLLYNALEQKYVNTSGTHLIMSYYLSRIFNWIETTCCFLTDINKMFIRNPKSESIQFCWSCKLICEDKYTQTVAKNVKNTLSIGKSICCKSFCVIYFNTSRLHWISNTLQHLTEICSLAQKNDLPNTELDYSRIDADRLRNFRQQLSYKWVYKLMR